MDANGGGLLLWPPAVLPTGTVPADVRLISERVRVSAQRIVCAPTEPERLRTLHGDPRPCGAATASVAGALLFTRPAMPRRAVTMANSGSQRLHVLTGSRRSWGAALTLLKARVRLYEDLLTNKGPRPKTGKRGVSNR